MENITATLSTVMEQLQQLHQAACSDPSLSGLHSTTHTPLRYSYRNQRWYRHRCISESLPFQNYNVFLMAQKVFCSLSDLWSQLSHAVIVIPPQPVYQWQTPHTEAVVLHRSHRSHTRFEDGRELLQPWLTWYTALRCTDATPLWYCRTGAAEEGQHG